MYRQGNQDYVDIAKTYAFNYLMREFSMHQNSYLINSIEITPTGFIINAPQYNMFEVTQGKPLRFDNSKSYAEDLNQRGSIAMVKVSTNDYSTIGRQKVNYRKIARVNKHNILVGKVKKYTTVGRFKRYGGSYATKAGYHVKYLKRGGVNVYYKQPKTIRYSINVMASKLTGVVWKKVNLGYHKNYLDNMLESTANMLVNYINKDENVDIQIKTRR